jgi:hypothetical protein
MSRVIEPSKEIRMAMQVDIVAGRDPHAPASAPLCER